mgnify:CR=1 FL=1
MELNLSNNEIDDEGVEHLNLDLKENKVICNLAIELLYLSVILFDSVTETIVPSK